LRTNRGEKRFQVGLDGREVRLLQLMARACARYAGVIVSAIGSEQLEAWRGASSGRRLQKTSLIPSCRKSSVVHLMKILRVKQSRHSVWWDFLAHFDFWITCVVVKSIALSSGGALWFRFRFLRLRALAVVVRSLALYVSRSQSWAVCF